MLVHIHLYHDVIATNIQILQYVNYVHDDLFLIDKMQKKYHLVIQKIVNGWSLNVLRHFEKLVS